MFAGRLLDATHRSKRRSALLVLAGFVVVTAASFVLGGVLEWDVRGNADAAPKKAGFNAATAWITPTATFLLWGWSDSQIQTYTYWLIGALYPDDGSQRTRMVGFFKLVQSLGWCVGFAMLPEDRCSDFAQLVVQGAFFGVGTLLALLELPSGEAPRASLNDAALGETLLPGETA